MYIYCWFLLGITRLDLNEFCYPFFIVIFSAVLIKFQRCFEKMTIGGYGSTVFLISTFFQICGLIFIYYEHFSQTGLSYLGCLLVSFACLGIDRICCLILSRYWGEFPTYFANTWYTVLTNISITIGFLIMYLCFDAESNNSSKKHKNLNPYHKASGYLLIMSMISLTILIFIIGMIQNVKLRFDFVKEFTKEIRSMIKTKKPATNYSVEKD